MCILQKHLSLFKKDIENCILSKSYSNAKGEIKEETNGHKALGTFIRSQIPINHIHEAIKETFITKYNINNDRIHPNLGCTKPELKVVGRLKEKYQDICITPTGINKQKEEIDTYMGKLNDKLGIKFLKNTLIINVRSQIISIAKNTDTILERTFAEPANINLRNDKIILGEFFLLPVYEIDTNMATKNQVEYKKLSKNTIEKYINFFIAIRDKENKTNLEKLVSYSECCLILVDFRPENIKIYKNTEDLKDDSLVSSNFNKNINELYFYNTIQNLNNKYLSL